MPMSRCAGRIDATFRPPSTTLPPSSASNPATTFSSVVLPEPLGPSRVSNSPGRTARSSPCSTSTGP